MSTQCTLRSNPTPLGWGDHIRWQHESGWGGTVGERYVIARRVASDLRRGAFDLAECQRIMAEQGRECSAPSEHFLPRGLAPGTR